jgi:hypothetical protein
MIPNNIQNISTFLQSKGTNTLALAYSKANSNQRERINVLLKAECNINLELTELSTVTDVDVKDLLVFESNHGDMLNEIIISAEEAIAMEKTTTSVSNAITNKVFYFGVALTAVTLVYLFCITWIAIPENNQRFADTILGFLMGTVLSTVITYFFGNSVKNDYKVTTSNKTAPDTQNHLGDRVLSNDDKK